MSNTPTTNSNRGKLIALLAVGAIFLIALAGVAFFLIKSFVVQPKQVVTLPPEAVQQSRATVAPPVAMQTLRAASTTISPTFKGNVIDATTSLPIQDFTVHIGYATGNGQPPFFNSLTPRDFHGGVYTMTSQMNLPSSYDWFVRIDARGHLPVVSDAQKASGNVNFELPPGTDIQGVVLDPAGAPVADATVIMAVPGIQGNFNPVNIQPQTFGFSARSGSDGKFTLPPQSGDIDVAAFTDKAFGEANQDASAGQVIVHLSDWGNIHGRLLVAGKPTEGQQIRLATQLTTRNEAYITTSAAATTDKDGNYQFDRVIPGQVRVYRLVRSTINQGGRTLNANRMGQFETVNVAPGQSYVLNFGGVGRPVTGKLILPTGFVMRNLSFNNSVSGQTATAGEVFPQQMPDNIKNGTVASRQMWMQLFELTAAGKEFIAAHPPLPPTIRQYTIDFADDGAFRIDDVVPGDYNLNLSANNRNPGVGGPRLLPYHTTFTVPPVPGGGYSDQPLVLPDIELSTR